MSTLTTTQLHSAAPATAQVSLLGLVAKVLHLTQSERAKRAIYRQTLRELNALTTRDLTDLGIHKSEIKRIATEAAYGIAA